MKNLNKEIRTNKFYLMTYCTKDFVSDVLFRKIGQIKCYAYIIHDKDVYLSDVYDDKKNLLHRAGDSELVHIHLYLELFLSRSPSEIVSWFKCFDDDGRLINTLRQYVSCSQNCVDYLTHKWDKEKYQYSYDEIVAYNLTRLDDGSYKVNDESDFTYDIICSLMNGDSLKSIVRKYGKDFVYHYSQYKELVSDLLDYKVSKFDFRTQRIQYNPDEDNLPF